MVLCNCLISKEKHLWIYVPAPTLKLSNLNVIYGCLLLYRQSYPMNDKCLNLRSDFIISIGISNTATVSVDVIALNDNFIARKTEEVQKPVWLHTFPIYFLLKVCNSYPQKCHSSNYRYAPHTKAQGHSQLPIILHHLQSYVAPVQPIFNFWLHQCNYFWNFSCISVTSTGTS